MVSIGNLVVSAIALLLVAAVAAWTVRHYAVPTVLRREARTFRLDRRALAVGAALLVAVGAAVLSVVDLSAPVVAGTVALLALAGVAGVTIAVANLDWYRAVRALPVSSPADAEPGPVQLEGVVADASATVESAVTETEAVAYRATTLEEHAVLGRGNDGSTWSPVSTAFAATAFEVAASDDDRAVDADGDSSSHADAVGDDATVAVDGPAAEYPLLTPDARLLTYTPAAEPLDGLTRSVTAEPGTTVPVGGDLERGDRPRPRRYAERRIDPGNEAYVLGTAERDGDDLRVVDDPDGPPLLVARLSADEARRHARHLVVGYGGVGLASLGAAALLAWQFFL